MLVHFKLTYWDAEQGRKAIAQGFTTGETLGQAADNAINYFGAVYVNSIEVCESDNVVIDENNT